MAGPKLLLPKEFKPETSYSKFLVLGRSHWTNPVELMYLVKNGKNLSETTSPLNPLPLVAVAGRASDSGATSILSRKKVTIPQPAKKLFIKLIKGLSSVFLS
ncbi:hypothetical protein LguiB_027751 [Lonicera macranthoides]